MDKPAGKTPTLTGPTTDPSHDVLEYRRDPLDVFFAPRSVALIGATEAPGSVGRTILRNLLDGQFGGAIYPINLKRSAVLGLPAYPHIGHAPGPVDLAIIATPAPTVPGVIRECVAAGVSGAIIISAGFKEVGAAGAALEQEALAEARKGNLRLIGPNCLGVMSPLTGLNASFAQAMAPSGSVALLSQSGALCTGILDWSLRENVGFSAFMSLGSMLDVGWGDLIDYLGNDPRTGSIVIYMESIGDARSFLSSARTVALTKPIIVIKAGRTEVGARAAASHTGSLTGSDEVLEAAFRRCGVLRVRNIADLFYAADVLAKQPRPAGPRLAILTNAGGPGVLATDSLVSGGGELGRLAPETVEVLNDVLPAAWSHGNPIDILGDAGPDRYARALEIAVRDPNSDGLLIVLTPQAMTDPTGTAEALKPYAHSAVKPILASWMGGPAVTEGQAILNAAGIPVFPYPDTAARLFNYLWQSAYNLKGLYETPSLSPETERADGRARAAALLERVRTAGRTLLTEPESKEILACYGIPTVETQIAASAADAVRAANAMGYPVVLKLYSETITHKTDVGGVQLNLPDSAAVEKAFHTIRDAVGEKAGAGSFQGVTVQPMIRLTGYELIVGSSPDAQFGPVLLFGSGGQLVEVMKDRALALPPLNTTLARRMMEGARIYTALKGVRGREPVDIQALADLLVRFSQLVVEQPWIREIDINPLLASPERLLALDARVALYDPNTPVESLPRLAIRPYPTQYIRHVEMAGEPLVIRPIRPEDEPAMVRFHQGLSERSVSLRYFHPLQLDERTAHDRLAQICFIDYDREMAIVAAQGDAPEEILGVGRFRKQRDGSAEFSMLVSDRAQNRGLGTAMLGELVNIARREGVTRLTASVLSENAPMQKVCARLGFTIQPNGKGLLRVERMLD